MKRTNTLVISAFSLLSSTALPCLAWAQSDVIAQTAPAVIFSATRTATPAAQVASSVSVLTEEDIQRRHKNSVVELLRELPGVSIAANGPIGQTARVFIRGADSRHTLVVVDGVTVNDPSDPSNAYDFAYLTPDNIARIEVLRGPQSTLYGADAIGGVIAITTKTGDGAPSYHATAEVGSHRSRLGRIGSSGKAGGVSYSVTASEQRVGNISSFNERRGATEDDPYENTVFSGRVDGQVTENLRLGVTGRLHDGRVEFDDFGADAPNVTHSNQALGRAYGNLSLLGGDWVQELGVSTMDLSRDSITGFGANTFDSRRNKVDWQHTVQLPAGHTGTLGLEASEEEFFTNTIAQRSINTKSLYVQDQFGIGDAFFMAIGARWDDHSTFGHEVTYRLAPTYLIHATGTKLKATYGTGFKAPAPFQLFSSFGDPTLKPEESTGWDAGFEQRLWGDTVEFGSTYFDNDIDQFIDFDLVTFTYKNLQSVSTKGVENFLIYRPDIAWTLTLNHTYTLAENELTGTALLRRPKHDVNALVDYRFADGNGGAQLGGRFVGHRKDVDLTFANTTMPSHFTLDVSADYAISEHATLYTRLDNLLDREYEEVFGYGTPGTTVYVGVKGSY